jgi:hypothetical protein
VTLPEEQPDQPLVPDESELLAASPVEGWLAALFVGETEIFLVDLTGDGTSRFWARDKAGGQPARLVGTLPGEARWPSLIDGRLVRDAIGGLPPASRRLRLERRPIHAALAAVNRFVTAAWRRRSNRFFRSPM